jgi:VIT1/CCC1 family predicted Fe2+/Mn2+ transporter
MNLKKIIDFRNISFGSSSAVITSLAIIIGLSGTINAKISIITALLIIAIADNVSDSFGIHVHQESECRNPAIVRRVTLENFIARLLITMIFILFVFFIPLTYSIIISIIFGLSMIIALSYFIAKRQKINPYKAIIQHLALALVVMIMGLVLRNILSGFASKLMK